jgi:hypothetical protein
MGAKEEGLKDPVLRHSMARLGLPEFGNFNCPGRQQPTRMREPKISHRDLRIFGSARSRGAIWSDEQG